MDNTQTQRGTLNQIDFRIFARKADGQYIPTQKGITISKDLAKYLKQAFSEIN